MGWGESMGWGVGFYGVEGPMGWGGIYGAGGVLWGERTDLRGGGGSVWSVGSYGAEWGGFYGVGGALWGEWGLIYEAWGGDLWGKGGGQAGVIPPVLPLPPPFPGAPAVLQDSPPQNRSPDAVSIEMDPRTTQQLQLLDEQVQPINSQSAPVNYYPGGPTVN